MALPSAGVWSSNKRRWKGVKDGVAEAFAIMSLPFVLAEEGKGVVSFATGQLSIPPMTGLGTSVGIAVLFAGLVISIVGVLKARESESER